MKGRLGIIANSEALKQRIAQCYPGELAREEIRIEVYEEGRLAVQAKEMVRQGARVLIARSGAYEWVVKSVSVPVIRLKITATDIIFSLKEAERLGKKIVFIQRDHIAFSFEEWEAILDLSVPVQVEYYHNPEEVEPIIQSYASRGESVTFVGGGLSHTLAPVYGFDSIFVNASEESIRETVHSAKQLIGKLEREMVRSELVENMLEKVHDAVLAVDETGVVSIFNERARLLLKRERVDVVNHSILEVLPELAFLHDALTTGQSITESIRVLHADLIVSVNATLIFVDEQIKGVLCTFQDITHLQMLEKKIRFQLNKRGLIAKLTFRDMIAVDPVSLSCRQAAKAMAKTEGTILIYGESGVGKEVYAQSIHNVSRRSHAPFVAVNCAALTETLLESELFGYEEGAFTGARKGGKPGLFELAHGGTIFLDEINSITPGLQVKLLRVLEEREVMRIGSDYVIPLDVRIIAASDVSLKQNVAQGQFRADLFYRLDVLELMIPPLRDRKADIPRMFERFLEEMKTDRSLEGVESQLMAYDWPGNVRELRNAAQRYALLGSLNLDQTKTQAKVVEEGVISIREIQQRVETEVIDMLLRAGHNKTEIAKILGISRTALWKKTKE
ncbi:sigma 54-interacting transcriptional regulator [Gottschalkiaceae bacterium SANA]|nr:sigma 54-interacting transcriptional regulator [Gottschalkiaceae bacterium SANA]